MSAPAELLRAVAARIDRNPEDEFAGCIVVIPPPTPDGRSGETLEIVMIDPERDAANFWTMAAWKLDVAVGRFKQIHETPQLGGYR